MCGRGLVFVLVWSWSRLCLLWCGLSLGLGLVFVLVVVWPCAGLGLVCGLVFVSSLSSLVLSSSGLLLVLVLVFVLVLYLFGLGLVSVFSGVVLVWVWSWSWLGLGFQSLAVFGVVRALPAWIQVQSALVPVRFGPADPLLQSTICLLLSKLLMHVLARVSASGDFVMALALVLLWSSSGLVLVLPKYDLGLGVVLLSSLSSLVWSWFSSGLVLVLVLVWS